MDAISCRKNVKLVMDPIVHPNYSYPIQHQNDIALLKLETVNLDDFAPACLPAVDTDYTGKTGHAYGESYCHCTMIMFVLTMCYFVCACYLALILSVLFLIYPRNNYT